MRKKVKTIIEIAVTFVFVTILFTKILIICNVPSESMENTVMTGEKIIATRIFKEIKRGEIIIFKNDEVNDEVYLIKRVIGVAGDKIEIADGQVAVNGEILDEPYVENSNNESGIYNVPENCVFVLGDNRSNSYDSRYWDNPYVSTDNIIGVVLGK